MTVATRAPRRATPDPAATDRDAGPRANGGVLAHAGHPRGPRPDQVVPAWLDGRRGPARRLADGPARRVRRPDGAVGLGQVDPAPGPRRPRSADHRRGDPRGRDDQRSCPTTRATRLRRDRTGFVFQSFNLIPLLDASENVGLPFTIAGEDPTRGELADRVRDVIELVDLTGKEHHKPDQLSAGEQQRVAIARALVTRPALLFADEPTGNLDYTTGTEILDALWRSCVERGQTVVLVTHDSKAAAYADRVLVIGDGRIRDDHRARPPRLATTRRRSSPGSPSSGCRPAHVPDQLACPQPARPARCASR